MPIADHQTFCPGSVIKQIFTEAGTTGKSTGHSVQRFGKSGLN